MASASARVALDGLDRVVARGRRRWPCSATAASSSGARGTVVAEVEAEPVGRHQRALLAHVVAQDLAGRRAAGGCRCGCGGWPRAAARRWRPGRPVRRRSPRSPGPGGRVRPGQGGHGVVDLGPAGLGDDRCRCRPPGPRPRRRRDCGPRRPRPCPARSRPGSPPPGWAPRTRRGPAPRMRWARRPRAGPGKPPRRPPPAVRAAWRARARCSAIWSSKRARSTLTPASPLSSVVSSIGKPWVSWSRKATSPGRVPSPSAFASVRASSSRARPVRRVRSKPRSSRSSDGRDMADVASQPGVGPAHHLDRRLGQGRGDQVLDVQPAGGQHGPADHPAQHVAPTVVGGQDAVGDEHGHAPSVVGQDPQGHVDLGVVAVAAPGERLGPCDHRGAARRSPRPRGCPGGS